jgi:hypothetical protein
MLFDDRKRKKRKEEVADPQMEANLKAIEEDAKRAESERLKTLAEPEPKKQPTISEDEEIESRRKQLIEKLKPSYIKRLGPSTYDNYIVAQEGLDIDAGNVLKNKPIQELESELKKLEKGEELFTRDSSSESYLQTLKMSPSGSEISIRNPRWDLEEKQQLAQSQAIQNLNNTVSASTGAASTTLVNATANNPSSTLTDLDNAREIGAEADKIVDKEITNDLNNANAQSQTLRTGVSTNQKPTYDPNNKQLDKDLKTSIPDAPVLALEKLGVQDYYPTVGRDIAVGTFTGSRIGSQTIYTGAGGLLPMGLYDERKRAKAKYVKENLAAIDKFLTVPDTYQVYNDVARPYAAGILQDIAAKNGYDYSKIMKDREGMIMVQKIKGGFEKFAKAGTAAEALKTQMMEASGDIYIPDNVRKALIKFTNAQMDPEEVKKYLTGEKNSGDLTKNLIAYAAGSKYIKEMSPTWFKGDGTSVPLSVKTGKELNPEDAKKMQNELLKLKSLNADNDAYITFTKKYFSIDPSIMENWAKEQGVPYDDEIIENWTDLLTKMIPDESIVTTIEKLVNNNADRALDREKLALEKAKFSFQKQQSQTEHQRIQDAMKQSDFNNNVTEAYNSSSSRDSWNKNIADVYRKIGLSVTNVDGKLVGQRQLTGKTMFSSLGVDNTFLKINGKWRSPDEILTDSGGTYSEEDKEAAQAVINRKVAIESNVIDYRAAQIRGGGLTEVNWTAVGGGVPPKKVTLMANVTGNLNALVTKKDENDQEYQEYQSLPYEVMSYGHDVNSISGQTFLDQATSASGSAPGKTKSNQSYSFESSSSE